MNSFCGYLKPILVLNRQLTKATVMNNMAKSKLSGSKLRLSVSQFWCYSFENCEYIEYLNVFTRSVYILKNLHQNFA
jgi:hypothetical protein